MQYTPEQARSARKADLYKYLRTYHSDKFTVDGECIHPVNNRSLSIKKGFSGYNDFATNDKGNPIEFLVRHMGYSFPDAVIALCDNPTANAKGKTHTVEAAKPLKQDTNTVRQIIIPEPVNGAYRQLYAYLMGRKIPSEIIKMLVDEGILYQEKEHNNMIFINKERDFFEIHGTISYGKSWHGCRKTQKDRFWWFRTSKQADVAYICEAAIDAISLYLLHRQNENQVDAYYISIGGAGK